MRNSNVMKRILSWMALAFSLLITSGGTAEETAKVVALVGATVIDGTGAEPLPDGVVLIRGERIAAVSPRNQIEIPAAAQAIDFQGKWIIPGLIDAHVHFFQSGGLYTRPDIIDLRDVRPYSEELAWIWQRLPQTFARYVASGVTSVVDMGGPMWSFQVRELAQRILLAPRVAVAGPLISNYAPKELQTADPAIIRVRSPEEARAVVRRVLEHRPDLVKLWLIQSPDQPLVAEEPWVRAAIEESHAAGVRVVAHATQLEMARAAAKAGADILAHSVEDRPVDDAFVQLLKERNIPYTTTLMVREGYREVLGQQVELSDIERRNGDPQVIATFDDLARLRPDYSLIWRRLGFANVNPVMFKNLRHVQDAGVTIAAGTDAGNIGTLHGPALHRELELMAQAGLTLMEILVAATRGGARVMGRAGEIGTIEAGKLADLVILDADPLIDIRNTRRIHRVVKGGVVLDPERILQNLKDKR